MTASPAQIHAVIALVAWSCWWFFGGELAISAVAEHWPVSLTMVFGSLIAGATSEGGGAVAFPVFTKVLDIAPGDAKVFSLAIQSVGMTAATLLIVLMRLPVDWWAIRWASLGGLPGIVIGAVWLAPLLTPAAVKLSFTVLVSSLALTLYRLNRGLRDVHPGVPVKGTRERRVILSAGLIGGVMSGLVGNGIDIITFSVLVMLFHVCEKVATPTSVILMAINSVVGFALHAWWLDRFTPEIQAWWLAAIPVVVVGAPLGAMFCATLNRHTIANVLIGLIAIEFVTSLWLIPISPALGVGAAGLLMLFTGVYSAMARSSRYRPV